MRFDERHSSAPGREARHRVRALFLSDVHLGTRASKSDRLLDFLRHHNAQTIYLVGDIVDGWRLRSRWHWPQTHIDLIDELLKAAHDGARVVYVPGNHDAFVRDYPGIHFAGIEVAQSALHVAADGRRYVVVHGDHFDKSAQVPHSVAAMGARLNAWFFAFSDLWSRLRLALGLSRWSLSQWTRDRVKKSIDYLDAFERDIADFAAAHSVDGVICGHVHHAAMHERSGRLYINCGDWLESCTAVVERFDGTFEIKSWPAAQNVIASRPPLGEFAKA